MSSCVLARKLLECDQSSYILLRKPLPYYCSAHDVKVTVERDLCQRESKAGSGCSGGGGGGTESLGRRAHKKRETKINKEVRQQLRVIPNIEVAKAVLQMDPLREQTFRKLVNRITGTIQGTSSSSWMNMKVFCLRDPRRSEGLLWVKQTPKPPYLQIVESSSRDLLDGEGNPVTPVLLESSTAGVSDIPKWLLCPVARPVRDRRQFLQGLLSMQDCSDEAELVERALSTLPVDCCVLGSFFEKRVPLSNLIPGKNSQWLKDSYLLWSMLITKSGADMAQAALDDVKYSISCRLFVPGYQPFPVKRSPAPCAEDPEDRLAAAVCMLQSMVDLLEGNKDLAVVDPLAVKLDSDLGPLYNFLEDYKTASRPNNNNQGDDPDREGRLELEARLGKVVFSPHKTSSSISSSIRRRRASAADGSAAAGGAQGAKAFQAGLNLQHWKTVLSKLRGSSHMRGGDSCARMIDFRLALRGSPGALRVRLSTLRSCAELDAEINSPGSSFESPFLRRIARVMSGCAPPSFNLGNIKYISANSILDWVVSEEAAALFANSGSPSAFFSVKAEFITSAVGSRRRRRRQQQQNGLPKIRFEAVGTNFAFSVGVKRERLVKDWSVIRQARPLMSVPDFLPIRAHARFTFTETLGDAEDECTHEIALGKVHSLESMDTLKVAVSNEVEIEYCGDDVGGLRDHEEVVYATAKKAVDLITLLKGSGTSTYQSRLGNIVSF